MLEVEDWTQQQTQNQASKRRTYSRRVTSQTAEPEPNPALVEEPLPIPAEPEVEESFTTPRPFPARSRANSTPSAGPSSLSRLLAQAPTEAPPDPVTTTTPVQPFPEVVIDDKEPEAESHEQQQQEPQSEVADTVSPSPPLLIHSSPRQQSPLRPGSRSSKVSVTSRMSIGRIPGGTVTAKSSPTTAIMGLPITAGKLPGDLSAVRRAGETPTPEGSPSDSMSNLLKQHHRRRATLSYSVPRPLPLTGGTTTAISHATNIQGSTDIRNETTASGAGSRLAILATSWGFGRRRKAALDAIPQATTSSDDQQEGPGDP